MTIRLTDKRKQILQVLKHQHGTMSVKDIHNKLPKIDQVTIYRSLDLFVKNKLIKEVHLGKEGMLYEYQTEPHHHAICDDCRKVRHFTAPDEKIKKLLGLEDFEVEEIEVIVKGVCKK